MNDVTSGWRQHPDGAWRYGTDTTAFITPPQPDGRGGWTQPVPAPAQPAKPQRTLGDPNEETLWEGSSQTVSGAATGGRAATRYRLTPLHLYYESGMLSTNSQTLPLFQVVDADLKQSMTQKARGVGDVVLHLAQTGGVAGTGWGSTFVMSNVRDPHTVHAAVRRAVATARQVALRNASTQYIHHQGSAFGAPSPAPSAPTPEPPAASATSLVEQLTQLAALRDQGILTEDEFAAQKAKLLNG